MFCRVPRVDYPLDLRVDYPLLFTNLRTKGETSDPPPKKKHWQQRMLKIA